jgi:hypothetical protein
MDYVMVPVPEEHVVDVMQHVARLVARASVVPWDDESIVATFDDVDEASRSVLSLAARSVAANKDLTDEDAAKTLELSVREIKAIVRDLQEVAQREHREPMVALREASVVLRNGRTVQKRTFTMTDVVARAIRAHERASLGDLLPGAADPSE